VFAHGGPAPDDYYAYEVSGADVIERRTGKRPDHADILFSYRPLDELPGILESAVAVGARTLWFQNDGSADDASIAQAKARVSEAGLQWVCMPILDAAR
jgi:predicted CoA-binding protein